MDGMDTRIWQSDGSRNPDLHREASACGKAMLLSGDTGFHDEHRFIGRHGLLDTSHDRVGLGGCRNDDERDEQCGGRRVPHRRCDFTLLSPGASGKRQHVHARGFIRDLGTI